MKVGTKLFLRFLLVLILIVAMGTMGYVLLKEIRKSTDMILLLSHKSKVTAKLLFKLRETLLINDFITSGNTELYDYYKLEAVLIEKEIKRLKRLNLNDQENKIVSRIEETLSILNKKTLEIVRLKDQGPRAVKLAEETEKAVLILVDNVEGLSDFIEEQMNKAVSLADKAERAGMLAVLIIAGFIIGFIIRREIQQKNEDIARVNEKLQSQTHRLQTANKEISLLIQRAIEDPSVRYENKDLKKCWVEKECKKEDCPSYNSDSLRCWQVSGTFCGGEIQGSFAQKISDCTKCEVYQAATTDEISAIGEQFNNLMNLLQHRSVECELTNKKLGSHEEELMTRNEELHKTMQELQKANKAIKELNMTLEKRVQERTQELVDMNAELIAEKERAEKALQDLKMAQVRLMQSAKMAAVGQLAGGIAHEINNPMGVILGFSQVIVKRVKEDDPLYKPIKSIERESMRCRKLVMNLLTFSRTGNQNMDKTDINTMIGEVLEIVGYQTKLRGIEIINSFGQDMPDILADKNQLQQVIMNLCTNAIDSIKNGRPGRLEIRTAKEEEDGYCGAKIEIEDNGSGISEEVRERMFEPFFTTKEVGQGTGLGLSICYEIIQRHNGSIYVESEKGKGSKFTIRLPIA